MGDLSISDVKPKIRITRPVRSMSVKAEVEMSMTVRLLETKNGATVWTDSAQGTEKVANVGMFPGGGVYFNTVDPEEAYGDLVRSLVKKVTEDLRASYKRM